jgi:hypothetical protein
MTLHDNPGVSAACTVCEVTWSAGKVCREVAAHVQATGHPVALVRDAGAHFAARLRVRVTVSGQGRCGNAA